MVTMFKEEVYIKEKLDMVRVSYSTEYADYDRVICISEISEFSKNHTITSVEEIEDKVITRQMAKEMGRSRDCHCVLGKARGSNFDLVIDKIYDYFE
jgi:hypothetical protein